MEKKILFPQIGGIMHGGDYNPGTVAGPAGHSGRRYPYDEESRDELCNTWGIFLVNL